MSYWIQTYLGKKFDLLDPQPDMVDILDIAHALSRVCRFTGHVPAHYSVAQHSVLAARLVKDPQKWAMHALLHDAQEAYVGDMSRPLKMALRSFSGAKNTSPYDEIEARVERAVRAKFGLGEKSEDEKRAVTEVDMRLVMTEKDLLGKAPQDWEVDAQPFPLVLRPQTALVAERDFLATFFLLERR